MRREVSRLPKRAVLLQRATRHLRDADPVLAGIIRAVGPCRFVVEDRGSPFATLAHAILYQQLTGKAAETIYGRLLKLIGRSVPGPEDIVLLSDEALRGVGLSRQKTASLRDLAVRAQAGLLDGRWSRRSDEGVIERLTQVRGIGRWTAEMFLMFRLGRLDVLPVDDYGVRKAMQQAYRMRSLPKPKRMLRLGERWRPYRSVASWYLWRSLSLKSPSEPAASSRPRLRSSAAPGAQRDECRI